MRLALAEPARVEEFKEPIAQIGNAVNDPALFERVKEACLNRRAFLFVGPEGFTVLKPIKGPAVLSWCSFTTKKADLVIYQTEVERLAKMIGAQWIEFWSVRPGFKKLATKLGYISHKDLWCGVPILVWRKFL